MRPNAQSAAILIAAAIGGVLTGGLGLAPLTGAIAGVAVLIGIAALFSADADRIAYAAVCLLVIFINWNGVRLGGGAVANAFMVAAFAAVVALVIRKKRQVPLPPWLLVASAGML